jgi:RNA polymerase sigma-70 factor (ECF subfamily)
MESNPNLESSAPACAGRADFVTTNWSVVLQAGNGEIHQATAALERLCQRYWYPLYAFVRRRGCNPHDAEDLTQSFFAYLLEKETLKKASRERGRFRSFLLASMNNFATNEWNKRRALKRGGQCQMVSLDEATAEGLYRNEPVDSLTPEKLFERRWAFTLMELVLARLREEYVTGGKATLFDQLASGLTYEVSPDQCAQLAAALEMNENGVRVALLRLRRRFGDLLRSEIAHTVSHPEEVDAEIRDLFAAISQPD